MKTYHDFIEDLTFQLMPKLPAGSTIHVVPTTTTNQKRDMLDVKLPSSNYSIRFAIQDMYDAFCKGEVTMSRLINHIVKQSLTPPKEIVSDPKKIFKKENLYLQLINAEENEELLKNAPHEIIEDLAIVVRCLVDENHSFLMTDIACLSYNITPEELFKYAKENNEKAQVEFGHTLKFVSNSFPEDIRPTQEEIELLKPDNPLHVIRHKVNDMEVYTAAAILSEKTMQMVADKFGENFYILPSSMDEVIVVSESDALDKTLPFLKQMVEEINETVVDKDLFLSNNIYYYDTEKKSFEIVNNNTISMNGR